MVADEPRAHRPETIAGALATGAHGTGARFGGLATRVRAPELVTPSGEVPRCDADHHTDVFSAARVGLGALGVVSSVTLQAVPAFALRAVEGPGALAEAIEGFEEVMTSTDHVEFYWFPHAGATLLTCKHPGAAEGGTLAAVRFDEFVAVRDRLDPAGVLGNANLDRVLGPVTGGSAA